ncbi:sugar-binding transcriptional regulator [Oceanobacillus kimchii]|uniref:sugar-binding transcriptional regulator n=1 Tax=Oceanobacillus kimchii TaxID=746691 RepID=UPI003B0143F5
MSYLDDKRLLIKIANMYYKEGEKQSEIAKKIGVSRSLISKYLTRAKTLGIVEIIIHDDDEHSFTILESNIEKKYGLREVICVPSPEGKTSKSYLGVEAGKYLIRVLENKQIVGVSAGTTMNEVATGILPTKEFSQVCFVPLVGGVGDEQVDIHANSIVAKISKKLNSSYHLLHAPVLVDSKQAKEVITNQTSITNIRQMGSQADIAMVGIGGSPKHSTMVKSYKSYGIIENLKEQEIVGDICYNFINKDGKLVNNEWNDKTISIDIEKLKDIPLVIGVAAGNEKVDAIKAALKGKFIDVLVTDEITATLLSQ